MLDLLGIIVGIGNASLIDFVLARIGRLVFEELDKLVEAGGDQTAQDGSHPVDPVMTGEGAGHDGGTKGPSGIDGSTGIIDTWRFDLVVSTGEFWSSTRLEQVHTGQFGDEQSQPNSDGSQIGTAMLLGG